VPNQKEYIMTEDRKPDIESIPAIKGPVRALLDFPWSMTLQDFFKHLDVPPKAKVGAWLAEGPGGGNPNVELHFEDRDHAMEYLRRHYPDDTDEFRASLIR
jgi:hypothetical protein